MDNILSLIKQKNMIQKGDTVIVALSGGADSMTLFHFLLVNIDFFGIKLMAAHVNHHLRQESDQEASAVKEYCENNNVELFLKELTPNGNTSEDWARQERYSFFESLAKKYNAKIATAHTASDNAETLIFRLCRGTGLQGACGIPPVRECFIRPLLLIYRKDTEEYCHINNISYFIDETNLTCEYARGRVRNSIMPQLNKVHDNAEKALVRFITSATQAQEYINMQAQKLVQNNDTLSVEQLSQAHIAVQKEALSIWLSSYCEINELIVNNACSLICKKNGKTNLPNNLALYNRQGKLYVATQKNQHKEGVALPLMQGEIDFNDGKKILCEIIEYENFINYEKVQKKGLIFCADYGKIPVDAIFRTRNEGDKFEQQGRNVTKTLKKLFCEDGILLHLRDKIPLLAINGRVIWLWGYGFCEGLQPIDTTKQVLTITIIKED